MMWGYYPGVGWWMWLVGGLMMLVFWSAVIGLVVWGVSQRSGQQRSNAEIEDIPLEIARRRLARGEITLAQFEELRKQLQ